MPPSPVLVVILAVVLAVLVVVVFTVVLIRTRLTPFSFAFAVICILTLLGLATYWTFTARETRGNEIADWLNRTEGISVSSDEALGLLEGGSLIVNYNGSPVRIEFDREAGSNAIVVYVAGPGQILQPRTG